MKIRTVSVAAVCALAIGSVSASAQPSGPDPYGYYSQYDNQGYFDRDGHYHRFAPPPPAPPPPPAYAVPGPAPVGIYEQGRYESNCRQGNTAAGTVFGALAGGLLGSAATHGNGAGVVGGAVLGGVLGNTIARDIDCEDHPYAFQVYATGLNGNIGRRYEWRHGDSYGYFTPTREFRRRDEICREFTETSYRKGRPVSRNGVACHARDGQWRFD
jgi:surface antigen